LLNKEKLRKVNQYIINVEYYLNKINILLKSTKWKCPQLPSRQEISESTNFSPENNYS